MDKRYRTNYCGQLSEKEIENKNIRGMVWGGRREEGSG